MYFSDLITHLEMSLPSGALPAAASFFNKDISVFFQDPNDVRGRLYEYVNATTTATSIFAKFPSPIAAMQNTDVSLDDCERTHN